jgi:RHS repeat-associated protein
MARAACKDGPWASDMVSYSNLANGLRGGLSVQAPIAFPWTQSYGYDSVNRLTSITSQAGAFNYTYAGLIAGSAGALISSLSLPNAGWITNTFDALGRETGTWLKNASGTTINSHQYVYNNASQRTQTTRTAGDYVNYTYDALGRLKTATGQEPGGAARLQEQLGYAYDRADNLAYRTNNALVQTVNTDNLNQLSTSTRTGAMTVSGTTGAAATSVAVNGQSASLYGDRTFELAGVALADGTNTFTAVARDSYNRHDTNTVSSYLPASTSWTYDANGNLPSDGRRSFDYDDENQLIRVTLAGAWKSEFVYDGQGRRRIRREYTWSAALGNWQLTTEVHYGYDGNLVLQERGTNNFPLVAYTRGLDLSHSLDGTGGIGGLLARTVNAQLMASDPSTAHAYYHTDGNGNVTALVNAKQIIVAHYLYDPYGNTLALSGPLADANTMRFSSKEWQENTGLYYYGFRFYDPNLQRWLNRDPALTADGPNLYAFVHNGPINAYDALGLIPASAALNPDFPRACPAWGCGRSPYAPVQGPVSVPTPQVTMPVPTPPLGGKIPNSFLPGVTYQEGPVPIGAWAQTDASGVKVPCRRLPCRGGSRLVGLTVVETITVTIESDLNWYKIVGTHGLTLLQHDNKHVLDDQFEDQGLAQDLSAIDQSMCRSDKCTDATIRYVDALQAYYATKRYLDGARFDYYDYADPAKRHQRRLDMYKFSDELYDYNIPHLTTTKNNMVNECGK